jgi:hypothetical protein
MHFEVKNLILILFLKCPYVKTYASTKNILIFQKVCDKEGQEKVHKLQKGRSCLLPKIVENFSQV